MDQAQEQHLDSVVNELRELVTTKYRRGQAEHGGNLWDNPPTEILDCAIDEAIDQVVYLLTLRKQLKSITLHGMMAITTKGEKRT